MAALSRVCLTCGQATRPTNRRLLSSEASTTVRQVWTELLAERLKERHQEVSNIQSLIEDGCVCKKCFMAVKAFYDRKVQLMINLDVAIDNNILCHCELVQFKILHLRHNRAAERDLMSVFQVNQ